jgi:hypothetical protein
VRISAGTHIILSCDKVWLQTNFGLLIGFIGWTLWYSAWLHFTFRYYTHTSVHSHLFTSRCFVPASNGGRSPSSVSRTVLGLSYQLLTATAHNDWTAVVPYLTHSLTCPAYNISARTAKKTPLPCCSTGRCLVTAVGQLRISRSLTSNGSTFHNTDVFCGYLCASRQISI